MNGMLFDDRCNLCKSKQVNSIQKLALFHIFQIYWKATLFYGLLKKVWKVKKRYRK